MSLLQLTLLVIFLPLCHGAGADQAASNASLLRAVWAGDHVTAQSILLNSDQRRKSIDAFHASLEPQSHLNLTALHLASVKGDARMTSLLVSHNASVELRDRLGFTPLLYAVWNGHPNVTRVLLHLGHADVNAKARYAGDELGTPPSLNALHLLALKGPGDFIHDSIAELSDAPEVASVFPGFNTVHGVHNEILAAMHKYSEERHIAQEGGETTLAPTSLSLSSETDRRERTNRQMIQLLLDDGIDAEAMDRDGDAPIHMAAFTGKLELIRMRIAHNASLAHLRTAYNATPLYNAVQGSQDAVVKYLLQLPGGVDVNVAARYRESNASNSTPLLVAAAGGFTDIALRLIDAGAEVDTRDILGNSPLLLGARRGASPMVHQILAMRPELINSTDCYSRTVLHNAVSGGSLETVQELLDKWPSVDIEALARYGPNDTSRPSFTPLLYAAMQGSVEIMQALHAKGANASAVDGYGNRAIHLAASYGIDRATVIKFLLANASASINEPNVRNHMTPLHMAIICSGADYLMEFHERDAMLEIDAKANYPFLTIGYFPKCPWLGPTDAELMLPSATPLHYALYQRQPHVAMRLIMAGADVNARDRFGDTALHVAVKVSTGLETISKLIEAGANVNARGRFGDTPLHAAVRAYSRSSESIVRLLIENGADGRALNAGSSTPLELAYPLGVGDRIFRLLVHNNGDSAQRAIVVRNNTMMVDHLGMVASSAFLTCDSSGKSALQLVLEHERIAMLPTLIKAGVRTDKLWCRESSPNHRKAKDSTAAGIEKLTPLELAHRRNISMIVELIENDLGFIGKQAIE